MILLMVSMIVPIRIAFTDEEPLEWFIFYIVTDSIFLIEIVLNFFTTVSDELKVYEITDRKIIAKKYLKGWFWIDVISIAPIDVFMMQKN